MQAIKSRAFSFALIVAISFSVLFFLISLSMIGIVVVGLMIGIGLLTWLIWHVGSLKLAKLLIRRDVKGKDVVLASPGEYSFVPLGIKPILRYSLYPALFSFSIVSLTYQALGLQVATLEEIIMLMLYAFVILPFSLFVPARWIIENSNVIVLNTRERLPRGLAYVEYVNTLIDFGAAVGLVLTVAQVVRSDPENPIGLAVAIPLFLVMLLVSPSLLATALFFRLSFLKRVRSLRQPLRLKEIDIRCELRCPNCNAEVSLGGQNRYCQTCGTEIA